MISISIAGSFAATYSYVSEFHTSSKQTQASVFIAASACAMWIVLSPLALLIIPMDWSFFIYTLEYKPWRLFLTCTSLINLWNAVAFTFLPESPKFLVAMNRKDEALSVLSKIYAINTGNIKEVTRNPFELSPSLFSDLKGIHFSLIR